MRRRHLLLAALAFLTAACQDPDAGQQVGDAQQAEPAAQQAEPAALDPGLVTVESEASFDETYDRLTGAIEENENLRVVATVDHQANAAGVDQELLPTRLIVFGNPTLGTPLMQSARSTAIDLPQKLLVWEDQNGRVLVTYNDPVYLRERHGIEGQEEVLTTISNALSNLATGGTP